MFCFVKPIFVEPSANKQSIFPVAWAQSANSGGQDSVSVGEEEGDSGDKLKDIQAEKQGEDWDFTPGIRFRIETFIGRKIKYGRWD
ncbi:MAG: hypothetical protein PVJ11_01040 [Syntrophobacterales bacterium]|jgi:hypothetical protein